MEDASAYLLRQFDTAWKLAEHHFASLSLEECLWRPGLEGVHVARDGAGVWRADWPAHEGYDLGPPSIAWLTWHMDYWWSMALDHNFGGGTLTREQVVWAGEDVIVRMASLHADWRARVALLSADDLASDARTKWPFGGRPFGDIVAWVNVELTKNAAEIGYARFLYAVRRSA